MPDHFTDQLAPVPALMAAAAATTTLRIGALVWDNDYKHPVVLAKELATMDLLSEGRLEIGLGAGWMISDYEQAGMPYDPAPVRIDRFVEGLAIIRRAMGGETFSFDGTHYRIDGYAGRPLPVQRPCPPILIGGGGKRVLGIAGREADIVGINGTMHEGRIGPGTLATMTAEAVDEKVGFVRAAAGERIGDIEMNIRVFMCKRHRRPHQGVRRPRRRARSADRPARVDAVRAARQPGEDRRGPARPPGAVGLLVHHRRARGGRLVRPGRRRAGRPLR